MPILSQLAYQPIAYGVPLCDPRFGKCIYSGLLDLTQGPVTFDPAQSMQLLDMKNIQSVYVDNAVGGITHINVSGTNFVLRIPKYKLGYFPLLTGDRPVFTLSSTALDSPIRMYFTNVPIFGYCYPIDRFTGGI